VTAVVRWVLGVVCRLLGVGCCVLGVGCCRLAIGYWLLSIGYCLLAIGYWLLSIGYWLLYIGYWMLAIGLEFKFTALLPRGQSNKSNKSLRLDKCHTQGLAVFGRRPSSAVAAVGLARKRPGEVLRN
jgi:hypothetical protein